jgi:hypothetical protein
MSLEEGDLNLCAPLMLGTNLVMTLGTLWVGCAEMALRCCKEMALRCYDA